MEYEVRITPYALRQMQEIVRYISATLQSPENSSRWLDTMKKELTSLSSMPARIPLTEEEPWHSQGIHKMVVKNFLVYFWIDTGNSCVWITAVVYGRRSQRQQLERMEMP
ncbi:MAG: type II toxin-antitoxin system RelE/ParE family toxin [Ruminococcus flavefaciens]|nr:type II toxin-antitoxin system RelE/ParE family toxin [Ruminococcus flavefaciens]